MKICVIGANGLMGRSLIDSLVTLADMEVTGFDRTPYPVWASVRWIQGDLQNFDDCMRLVEGQDVIFHLAHTNSPLTSDQDMVQDTLLNLVPTLKLLKAIEKEGRNPHLIYPSSGGAIYGISASKRRFIENDPCLPLNSYGIQKLVIEHYFRLAFHHGLLTATIFRIANAYGWLLPPDRSQGFIGTAVTRFLTGQPIRLMGNPENVRDYIHIDDIIEAFLLSLSNRDGFEIYNIGTGVGTSVNEVIKILESLVVQDIPRMTENVKAAKFLPNWCVLDISKAQRMLGWHSKINLEEGIKRMLVSGLKK
jgi:UDP-glucose 4-epimerase